MVAKDLKKFASPVFPFTAIVGQEEMKLALQLNVIDPKIGGVMIMGDRGTGKSTTIRAIADLLPEIEVVKDDPFNSHKSDLDLMGNEVKQAIENNETLETEQIKIPMIDLPLGATEDRVCGTIDIEKALTPSVNAFSISIVPQTRSSVAPSGRSTIGILINSVSKLSPVCIADLTSFPIKSKSDLCELNGSSFTTSISGSRSAIARIVVDLPVPRSPIIITPPILGSITFNCKANFISSCPTIAVNGKTGEVNFFKSCATIF